MELKLVHCPVTGTGDIDFDEFCTLMARQMGLDDEEEPIDHKEAFKLFDKKGNGTIGVLAFREVLGKLSERLTKREIDNIMEEIDPDTDGKINFAGRKSIFNNWGPRTFYV